MSGAITISHKKEVVQIFFTMYDANMEKEIERHFVRSVQSIGGRAYKFTSPGRRGVADRIACLPDGAVWFVELKTKGGRLSELQKHFASEMKLLNQNYAVLWNKEQVDLWTISLL